MPIPVVGVVLAAVKGVWSAMTSAVTSRLALLIAWRAGMKRRDRQAAEAAAEAARRANEIDETIRRESDAALDLRLRSDRDRS